MALPALLERIAALPAFTRLVAGLPARRGAVAAGDLPGSSGAALVAALAEREPNRLLVVVADHVADAERWLADLTAVRGGAGLALYPPREGFGEVEPHVEIAGERVETLAALAEGRTRVLVTTGRAVMERTRLPSVLASRRLELARGTALPPAELIARLEQMGFERVPALDDVAQFAVRGGIVDVYGFGMAEPVRLEWDDDVLAELRPFDLTTQRSRGTIERVSVLPAEPDHADADPVPGTEMSAIGPTAEDGASERATLPDLWPDGSLVVYAGASRLEPELRRTWDEATHHAELARRRGEDVPPREELFTRPDITLARLREFPSLTLFAAEPAGESADGRGIADTTRLGIRAPETINRDMKLLATVVRDGTATMILCDNSGQAERLEEILAAGGLASPAAVVVGVLGGGFILPGPPHDPRGGLRVLTDHEIFRRERRLRRARRYASGAMVEHITALQPGDFVVHLEHGVGIYRGLSTMFSGETTIEVVVIEYEGGDRLNVPLYRLDQVERYRAAADVTPDSPPPTLHRLGGKRWQAQRDKVRSAIREMTAELLDLYARRKIASRAPHLPDTTWQRQLESSFLFEDTPDQVKAADDIKRDMEGVRPMDRLLVGDVGYGKTEVAVRAAFKAVQSERQVAVLVPTTILAEQHRRTFADRFADFPVKVEVLSRFAGPAETKRVLAAVKAGTVDVVIGTHRLLSADVEFKRLGLIVVDEEHRFGVKHKERLKQLKLETDVLTLTATPIPRTLHQALAGLRDLTVMHTAPRDRSPVLTFVEPWDDGLLEEGIARELDRGGQVFVVHNRIETIQAIADHLQRIVPRARIGVGHGQLTERELERVMTAFVAGELDVLVSTLIVESGLDVPNANTMFVNRADHLGLAQLYQLRGRVGRSHRRAYCYLTVPDQIDERAERRMKVLEHHTELGAGYQIALKDLEIRGAGNLLGPEQSGFVHAVGFDLYLRMLEEAVDRIRRGDNAPPPPPADVSLDQPAFVPDTYIESGAVKLDVYRRLHAAADVAAVEAVRAELRDRFGPLPAEAARYFQVASLRRAGAPLGIEGILVRGEEARVNFRADALPRLKPLSAAFREVQFQVDVRRVQPLSLKLTRLGGSPLLDGLIRALQTIAVA
ncbi:MAG: transcription-repair coupling factor [Gemmatimonadetes bacterium]|nr:transcription-repair coupling factor [Gemmatimonadota bacterium]